MRLVKLTWEYGDTRTILGLNACLLLVIGLMIRQVAGLILSVIPLTLKLATRRSLIKERHQCLYRLLDAVNIFLTLALLQGALSILLKLFPTLLHGCDFACKFVRKGTGHGNFLL